jgi:hypothetical protein
VCAKGQASRSRAEGRGGKERKGQEGKGVCVCVLCLCVCWGLLARMFQGAAKRGEDWSLCVKGVSVRVSAKM